MVFFLLCVSIFISHLYEDICTPGSKRTLPPTVGCWEHCVVNLKKTLLNYCLFWLHMLLHSYFLVQLSGSQCELSGNLWFVADNDLFKKLCPKMCFCLTSSCSTQYFTKFVEKMNTPQKQQQHSPILSWLDCCDCCEVSSQVHQILSSNLSRKFKTLLQDLFSWHSTTATQHLLWKNCSGVPF